MDWRIKQCFGKKKFEKYEQAKERADQLSKKFPTRAYLCKACEKFHLAGVEDKPKFGWHAKCGGPVPVIYRIGGRFCGKCLERMAEIK
jgi:hypothetical protein